MTFNPSVKKNKKLDEMYSHEDISLAIRRFQENGGLIKQLPEQAISSTYKVSPKERHAPPNYEPGFAN